MTRTTRLITLTIASFTAAGAAAGGALEPSPPVIPPEVPPLSTPALPQPELETAQLVPLPEAVRPSSPTDAAEVRGELVERMRAALLGNNTQPRSPSKRMRRPASRDTKPSRDTKRWSCGDWEELWQGHGQARSCEWR